MLTLIVNQQFQVEDGLVTACKRGLGQGNVFTPVCLSIGGDGDVMKSLSVMVSTMPCKGQHPKRMSSPVKDGIPLPRTVPLAKDSSPY